MAENIQVQKTAAAQALAVTVLGMAGVARRLAYYHPSLLSTRTRRRGRR